MPPKVDTQNPDAAADAAAVESEDAAAAAAGAEGTPTAPPTAGGEDGGANAPADANAPAAATKKWRIATVEKDFADGKPKGDIEFYLKNASGDGPEGDKVEDVNTITTENVGNYVVEDETTTDDNGDGNGNGNGNLESGIIDALENQNSVDMRRLRTALDKKLNGKPVDGGRRRSRRKHAKKSKKSKKTKKASKKRRTRRASRKSSHRRSRNQKQH